MPPQIDLWRQLGFDLKGKDAFRGISLSYGWLANQTGHICLGLLLAAIIYWLYLWVFHVLLSFSFQSPAYIGPIPLSLQNVVSFCVGASMVFWALFETLNVYWQYNRFFQQNNGWIDIPNMLYDVIIDVFFFFIGALIFGCIADYHWSYLVLIAIFLIVVLIAGVDWYKMKVYIQTADLPFQFRMGMWENELAVINDAAARGFLEDPHNGRFKHMMIYGPSMSGKTRLAVGLATEGSMKEISFQYSTANNLIEEFEFPEDFLREWEHHFVVHWTWHEAECLIIDDISGRTFDHPQQNMAVMPQDALLRMLLNLNLLDIAEFMARDIVWVISAFEPQEVRVMTDIIETLQWRSGHQFQNYSTNNDIGALNPLPPMPAAGQPFAAANL